MGGSSSSPSRDRHRVLHQELLIDSRAWEVRLRAALQDAGHPCPAEWRPDDDGLVWLSGLPLEEPIRRRVDVIRRVLERLTGQLALLEAEGGSQ